MKTKKSNRSKYILFGLTMRNFSVILLLLSFVFSGHSQVDYNTGFPLEAGGGLTPSPRIILNWDNAAGDNAVYDFHVERSSDGGSSWGMLATYYNQKTLTDSTVAVGKKYIYKICRRLKSQMSTSFPDCNKIEAAIELPEINFKGGVVLVVTQKSYDSLATQLEYYEHILQRDGWKTKLMLLPVSATVASVKDSLIDIYNDATFDLKNIILIGNVPVPYSGDLAPDGHPDHQGAWVADQYYADFIGTWTDTLVNRTTATRNENDNIIGDGKFDQSTVIPEVAIGRIDFSRLNAFPQSETELLRKYLTKNIDFRKGLKKHRRRCIVKDSFAGYGFFLNGISATTVVGIDSVFIDNNYRNSLKTGSYLFSYGAGAGNYTSASGITNTTNFTVDSLMTVFNMLFGSYFGDYDISNNLLRASIASGSTLTTFWGGRSGLSYYKMGLGGTFGDNFLKRIDAPYYCVIGDPTLTAFPFDTVPNVLLAKTNNEIDISWQACPISNLIGYNIYRKKSSDNYYQKINPVRVTSTNYKDVVNHKGKYIYMVRAISLEKTSSGTFYDLNLGTISDTADVDTIVNTSYFTSIKSCSGYVSPSGNYNWTTSGTYNDTLANHLGNDSLLTILLTIEHPTVANHTVYHCGTQYVSPSGKFILTSSGIYNDTIVNAMGCDSILTINLTLDSVSQNTIVFSDVNACVFYLSPSGKYSWNKSGTYFDTLHNPLGCDSIIVTNLTINHNKYFSTALYAFCDTSFVSPSGKYTWTVNGVYSDTIQTTTGCDSIIFFNVYFNDRVTKFVNGYVDCNGYVSPSGNYTWTTPGLYIDTLQPASGCDTIFIINLVNTVSLFVDYCDTTVPYTSPSGKYTWNQAGTYRDTITSTSNCDSIILIYLSVNAGPTGAGAQIINDTFPCNGAYVSPSGLYTWTVAGNYTDTLSSVNGCDSILYIKLSMGDVNSSISIVGDTFIVNYYAGCTYQWLDCMNNYAPISGATQQKFSPSVNGNYAAVINLNGCIDTSFCEFYTAASIKKDKKEASSSLYIYPNPTLGYITIKTNNNEFLNANIEIFNSIGQLVSFDKLTGNQADILISTPPGIYFVRAVRHNSSSGFMKIVKTY